MNFLAVIVGSAIGGLSRYGVGLVTHRFMGDELPFGTLIVNTLGCAIVGFLASAGGVKFDLSHEARLLLVTGFCGGFTTFSSFVLESESIFRGGAAGIAVAYGAATLLLGFGGFLAGAFIGRL